MEFDHPCLSLDAGVSFYDYLFFVIPSDNYRLDKDIYSYCKVMRTVENYSALGTPVHTVPRTVLFSMLKSSLRPRVLCVLYVSPKLYCYSSTAAELVYVVI